MNNLRINTTNNDSLVINNKENFSPLGLKKEDEFLVPPYINEII